MDIDSMHEEFKLLMDKADGGGAPSFLSSEIDRFLNAAIEKFVAKRAFGNNPRRTGFEEDQKRRDDLRNLISTYSVGVSDFSAANKPNGIYASLPVGYRHSINEEATITSRKDGSIKRVPVKPITHDRYNKIVDDPFNKPEGNIVYRLDSSGNKVELLCGEEQEVTKYHLRYLKNPQIVSASNTPPVNCDLANHTHREIVRMAVVEALENIEDPRYQSSKIELNEIE
jgi:hypothetical protein